MKILFITTRNIVSTCGELRLIKNRALTLLERFNIETQFIGLIDQKHISSKNKELIHKDLKTEIISCKKKNIYSFFQGKQMLTKKSLEWIDKENFEAIIVSGYIPISLIRKIKKKYPNKIIISDVHGAYEEFIEYSDKKWSKYIINYMLFKVFDSNLLKQVSICDAILTVSSATKKYFAEKGSKKDINSFVVPCSITKTEYNYDYKKYLIMRKKYRDYFKLEDDTIAFVYSGGNSKWQKIKQVVKVYEDIAKKINRKTVLIIMSNDIENIQNEIGDRKGIIYDSFMPEEVCNVLTAFDYGFLLRNKDYTNYIAFPNKFAEYISAGVNVICSKSLCYPNELAEKYNIGITYDDEDKVVANIVTKMNEEIIEKEEDLKKSKELIDDIDFEVTLKKLVKYISK